jgi:hypothetical protein
MTKMRLASLAILLVLSGCSRAKPVKAHLVAPPDCVKILGPIPLSADGKAILPHSHFPIEITCVKAVR